jgi:hypothetical protein
MSNWDLPEHDPVITIVPVTASFARYHGLSPDARLAVVEVYQGKTSVCCTDCDTPQGVEAAARAWAEATGAAYAGAA